MIAIWIIKSLFCFASILAAFIAIGQAISGQFPKLFLAICVVCLAIWVLAWLIEKTCY